MFQEPEEQPLLGYMIAEEKPDILNILKSRGAFCDTNPVPKPLETEQIKYGLISMLFGLFSQLLGVREFIFGIQKSNL